MGANATCTDDEFLGFFDRIGPGATAKKLGINVRAVLARRRRLEGRLGRAILSPIAPGSVSVKITDFPEHVSLKVRDGVVLIGSDLHIWPGERSTAIRAFIKLIRKLKPQVVILNGDVLDFPRISRHAPIGWEKNPAPAAEIEAAQDILHDIEQAAGPGIKKVWPLGNHDARFESQIAQHNPEYANVKGIHLSDHFPNWEKCWLALINEDVAVKHRFKSGIHAPHNNTLWSGRTFVTGHLHSQKVMPITDYNGTRYGVDTGCMADIYGSQFRNYMEENPRSWRAGFGVFTFRGGILMPPELVTVFDKNRVTFRGELIEV
jgi:hypothetical protein